jgi:hypothetical protein
MRRHDLQPGSPSCTCCIMIGVALRESSTKWGSVHLRIHPTEDARTASLRTLQVSWGTAASAEMEQGIQSSASCNRIMGIYRDTKQTFTRRRAALVGRRMLGIWKHLTRAVPRLCACRTEPPERHDGSGKRHRERRYQLCKQYASQTTESAWLGLGCYHQHPSTARIEIRGTGEPGVWKVRHQRRAKQADSERARHDLCRFQWKEAQCMEYTPVFADLFHCILTRVK